MSKPSDLPVVGSLDLSERLERAKAHPLQEATPGRDQGKLDALRAYWAEILGGEDSLRKRLQWDGLDEGSLPVIFDDAPGPVGSAQEWVQFHSAVVYHFEGARSLDDDATSGLPFGEVWAAYSDIALLRLRAVPMFGNSVGEGPSLGSTAWQDLAGFLARRLSPIGSPVLFADFDAYRRDHDPLGASPHTYPDWIAHLRNGGLRKVMVKFPVLARSLATITADAVDSIVEWWKRLCADWSEIRTTFSAETGAGEVVSLKLGMSDRHYHGRQAIAMTLGGGERFVYKPKSMDLDAAFSVLLRNLMLRTEDSDLFPSAPQVIGRPGYGWAKFVQQDEFSSRADVARYYRRCGSLLLLVYAMEGIDFTMDNVVASLGGPAAIDCETLLQPLCLPFGAEAVQGPELDTLKGRLLQDRDFSVLDTGLLPSWQPTPDGGHYDISGIGGQQSYCSSAQQEKWVDVGTSVMQMKRGPVAVKAEANAVILDGKFTRPEEFAGEIIDGFESAYRLLMQWRARPEHWFMTEIKGWSGRQVRLLLRATGIYGRVLQRMLRAEHLTHALFSDCIAEGLWKPFLRGETKPAIAPFLYEEAKALQRLDIPCFHLPAAGDDRTLFLASPLDMALNRIESMSDDDLVAQKRIIRASFALPPRSKTTALGQNEILAEAMAIAKMIELGDAESHGEAHSMGRPVSGALGLEAGSADVSSRDFFLYDGSISGQALFFAALAKVSDDRKHRERAIALLAKLRRITTGDPNFLARATSLPLGAASGLASLAYTFLSASRLLQTDEWQADASAVAELVTEAMVKADPHFDLLCGAAGAVMVFAGAAGTATDDVYLDRAVLCGEHLLASALTIHGLPGKWWRGAIGETYMGYGHGAAGIAAALARLGAFAGMDRFRVASQEVFRAIEDLFDSERRSWPVLVRGDGTTHHQAMESLCHGSPGIALAAMEARKRGLKTNVVIERAIEVMLQSPLHEIDTLCCGNTGRLETFLTLRANGASVPAEEFALGYLSRREACGIFRSSRKRSEQWTLPVGFFRGLSGMGYSLLRLGWPSDIPSVAEWS